MNTKLTIVVLTYNCISYTKEFFFYINKFLDVPSNIIVLDNGSTDGTKEYLSRELYMRNKNVSQIKIIFSDYNKGFVRGCNKCFTHVLTDYVLLLNNDCLITEKTVSRLLDSMKNSLVGAVGPVTNKFGNACFPQLKKFSREEFVQLKLINSPSVKNTDDVDVLLGHCLLLRMNALKKTGYFDERYGLGNFEDIDLCLTLKEKGYSLILRKDAFVYHYGHTSFEENQIAIDSILIRNQKIFEKKWSEMGSSIIKKYLEVHT